MFVTGEKDQIQVEAALQWTTAFRENIHTFTNNIATREGGTHLSGLKTALTRTINSVARKRKQLKEKDSALEGNDVREGLTVILSIKVPDPQFEGQTKTKLGNSEVKGIVDKIMTEALSNYFAENLVDKLLNIYQFWNNSSVRNEALPETFNVYDEMSISPLVAVKFPRISPLDLKYSS